MCIIASVDHMQRNRVLARFVRIYSFGYLVCSRALKTHSNTSPTQHGSPPPHALFSACGVQSAASVADVVQKVCCIGNPNCCEILSRMNPQCTHRPILGVQRLGCSFLFLLGTCFPLRPLKGCWEFSSHSNEVPNAIIFGFLSFYQIRSLRPGLLLLRTGMSNPFHWHSVKFKETPPDQR